jgi:putative hydrolase of the HAD superfamily
VKSGLKAVVFDYGKVISHPPADSVTVDLAALAGLPVKTLEGLIPRYRSDYDRGLFDAAGYYEVMLGGGGIHADRRTLERMAAIDLDSWSRVNEKTVRLMEWVKEAGFKLGILSNMPFDFLAMARKRFPVFSMPDVGIFSCETGSVKPEAAIYRTLISALGCEPREIVFFDDIQVNVDGAGALGINAFLWEGPEAAREIIGELSAKNR